MLLNNLYKEKITGTKEYLKDRYPLEICTKEDEDFPENIESNSYIVWKIKVENNLCPLTLIIAIPKTFPDKLPKIYLSKKDYANIAPIPHVDKYRFVCTRDPNVVFINEKKAGEALVQLINIATDEIINKGINKENTADFIEEFLSYWNEETKHKFLSLFKPTENIENLKVIGFSRSFLNSSIIIARTLREAQKWLVPFKIEIDENKVCEALYLPFSNPLLMPFPRNNEGVFKIIKNAGEKYSNALESYFNQRDSNLIVIFSFPLNEERLLVGWVHSPWQKTIVEKGFTGRRDKIPLQLRMERTSTNPIKKIQIERVDRERLFKRGGIGIQFSNKDASIAIIGCGSLGSPLTISLSKCGISKFLLVDNECVETENVARHVCGFFEAGHNFPKSEAVKDRLIRHFPYIDCNAYCKDILVLLQENESLLNTSDLIIVATGAKAVERRLNYLMRKRVIIPPLVYIWMEPFGVAGQILYISPENEGCYQCCFENYIENGKEKYRFRYSVVRSDDEFRKRECGCQSTFVQYSNLEIDHFISVVSKKIMTFLEKKPDCSLLYTWLGDLSFFRSLGYQIRDEWLADLPYTVHEKVISKNENCDVCRKF